MILFAEKSEDISQDAIMAQQVPCFQPGFEFLNIENGEDFENSSGEVVTKNKKRSTDLTEKERNQLLLETQAI